MKTDAVFSMFRSRSEAEKAEQALVASGFNTNQIAVLVPPVAGARDFPGHQHTKILTGAEIGAACGLFAGAMLGMLVGLQTFSLPLFDGVVALNGWTGALLGAIFGCALGASSGALVGIGTPETAPERLATYVDEGGILLSVHTDSVAQMREAIDILERSGGNDITAMNEKAGWSSATLHVQKLIRI